MMLLVVWLPETISQSVVSSLGVLSRKERASNWTVKILKALKTCNYACYCKGLGYSTVKVGIKNAYTQFMFHLVSVLLLQSILILKIFNFFLDLFVYFF